MSFSFIPSKSSDSVSNKRKKEEKKKMVSSRGSIESALNKDNFNKIHMV